MVKIVRFHTIGSADVLKLEDLPSPEPKEGEVRLKAEAIGLNRADVLFREGKYLEAPNMPSGLGYEAAGIVEAVRLGVNDTFPLRNIVEAHPYMESNQQNGKIVVIV